MDPRQPAPPGSINQLMPGGQRQVKLFEVQPDVYVQIMRLLAARPYAEVADTMRMAEGTTRPRFLGEPRELGPQEVKLWDLVDVVKLEAGRLGQLVEQGKQLTVDDGIETTEVFEALERVWATLIKTAAATNLDGIGDRPPRPVAAEDRPAIDKTPGGAHDATH